MRRRNTVLDLRVSDINIPDSRESIKVELGLSKVSKWMTDWVKEVTEECKRRNQARHTAHSLAASVDC